MAEQHVPRGHEGALGKKELILNNPLVLHMHQPLCQGDLALATKAKNMQMQYSDPGKPGPF